MGFSEDIVGDHHIFRREDVPGRINLQPTREAKCKPYQVRQMREVLVNYVLGEGKW